MAAIRKMAMDEKIIVLGAGYTGLTTAAELVQRKFNVQVIAKSFGHMPPLTIVGTQSRRWPGTAISNSLHDSDKLLKMELASIQRLLPLCHNTELTGVSVIPGLKVSKKANNTWNGRPIESIELLQKATKVQWDMHAISNPKNVDKNVIEKFKSVGYKSVSETQVIKIETEKYFKYLINTIHAGGGIVSFGDEINANDFHELQRKNHVINCLGINSHTVGNANGKYYSSRGEVVIINNCLENFDYYVIDDDNSSGVMQMPDGSLYLSTGAEDGPDQTKNSINDCKLIFKALFGTDDIPTIVGKKGLTSWKTGRIMREGGFNYSSDDKNANGFVTTQNNGHGGAGVTASWATAELAVNNFLSKI